jgi:hypothetical protein
MATCDLSNIEPIMRFVIPLAPASILDLGVGFGKWGVLFRDYLEGRQGRFYPPDWKVRLIGVEGCRKYWNPAYQLYDQVVFEDFTEHYHSYKNMDLVLMIDSLEHVGKEAGIQIVDTLRDNNKTLLVSVPQGPWPQGSVHGNHFEQHRATWYAQDLLDLGGRLLQQGPNVSCAIAVFDQRGRRLSAA